MKDNRAEVVDLPGENPHCWLEMGALTFRWSEMMPWICLSRILLRIGRMEMGR